MNKLAVFVEGYTEVVFVEKLIEEIDPAITVAAIKAMLGFDPENDDLEQRPTPAVDLGNCYAIGSKTYQKRMAQDTVDALDYALVYCELGKKFRHLDRLVASINGFLV